jgi:hypothetical protein
MTDFVNQFRHNEALYSQARAYWSRLENASVIIFIIFLVLGTLMAAIYYQPYNNRPGRRYTPIHWLIFLALTFILTFFVTWGFEYLAVPPKLDGAAMKLLNIALGNALYTSILYVGWSCIWCLFLPTNAYRFFKKII